MVIQHSNSSGKHQPNALNISTFGERTWFLEDSAQGKSPGATTEIPLTAASLPLHPVAIQHREPLTY
ncbi:hypothetical protein ACFOGG_05630 [Brenneria rubrifaciens]|uniref:hypothetical protein n=1 Tax=Brenneria rubrifaciens TaxID=55213 RepID=UPI00361DB161